MKEEEFARAVALALFDYLRKSRAAGSSSRSAAGRTRRPSRASSRSLVAFRRGRAGTDGFPRAALRTCKALGETTTTGQVVRALLTCVYQATAQQLRHDAQRRRAVAEAVGAEFLEFDVDKLVKDYVAMVSGAIGRELAWETDDIALQNIQARVRSPGVWMLANLRRRCSWPPAIAARRRSATRRWTATPPAAFRPIAGIDKAFLRQWLRWLEQHGPGGVGPIPALAAVNRQAPTAELRPPEQTQTDEADLMPYDLLDAIERAAIRDKQTPMEVYLVMRRALPAVHAAAARPVGRAVLPALVPQPVEARALRPQLPSRRRKPRPQDLVPLPDPLRRLRPRVGRVARVRRQAPHPRAGGGGIEVSEGNPIPQPPDETGPPGTTNPATVVRCQTGR